MDVAIGGAKDEPPTIRLRRVPNVGRCAVICP